MKSKLLTLAFAVALMSAANAQAQSMFGLTNSNELFVMGNTNNPSSINGPYSISGVTSGQVLVALDSRNRDGSLYAMGYNSTNGEAQLYRITGSGSSYTANAVNSSAVVLNLGSGSSIGFNFISTLDNEIRITGMNGQSYSMNADNGSIINTSTNNMSYATGDINSAATATIGATAYTNNYYGADATDEYGYDLTNNVMVKFSGANYYNNINNYPTTLHTTGLTGVLVSAGSSVGMDSWYDTMTHTNSIWMTATPTLGSGAHMYKMDNLTGVATDMGVVGSGTLTVRDFTMQRTRDTSMANSSVQGQLIAALTLNTRSLIFFDSRNPFYIRRMTRLSGMSSGQAMLSLAYGMDQKLYGLGYNSGNQTYQLYTIDTLSGAVHAVNNSTGNMNLGNDNSTYGNGGNTNVAFNFIGNATNRIRVIGNNGMTNLQLDATTGAIVEVDSDIHYMSGDANFGQAVNIGSMGYLNSYNGSNNSDMIGYDFNTGSMVGLNTSNNGYGSLVTNLSLSGVLNIFGSGNTYHNGYMDIWYDVISNTNIGFMASNYYGDSTATDNYSTMYTMNNMTTTSTPANAATIGDGTPVKGMAARKAAMPTGVNTVANSYNNALFVYPNPTTNNTRIVLPDASIGKVRVDVIDLDGRVVNEYVYPAGSYNLDISMGNMPNGLYSVRVSQKGATDQNVKVIKN